MEKTLIALVLGILVGALVGTAHASVCLVVATVDSSQSPLTAGGDVTAPVPGFMKTIKLNATGSVFLRLPSGSDPKTPCPKVSDCNKSWDGPNKPERGCLAKGCKGRNFRQPECNYSVMSHLLPH